MSGPTEFHRFAGPAGAEEIPQTVPIRSARDCYRLDSTIGSAGDMRPRWTQPQVFRSGVRLTSAPAMNTATEADLSEDLPPKERRKSGHARYRNVGGAEAHRAILRNR